MTEAHELAVAFRLLANMIEDHPEMADWYRWPRFSQHQLPAGAGNLDRFAELWGVEVEHHEPHADDGARYSEVGTKLGPLQLSLQCRTEAYEQATGTTVPTPEPVAAKEN